MLGLKSVERWLVVGERKPRNPDVIVPIGYGTLQETLVNATRESVLRAVAFAKCYPSALIAYANSGHCFFGSELVEGAEKQRLFRDGGIAERRLVDAGRIINSVTEAEAIRETLWSRQIVPREVLLIADKIHGRSVLWIWKRVFPGVRLALQYIGCPAYQSDALFPLQRSELRWIFANVARQLALRLLGLDAVRRIKHKS